MSDYSIDGLIRYFEMAVKVMGYTNPEQSSYEYHAAKMLKQLREERDNARRMYCESVTDIRDLFVEQYGTNTTPNSVAIENGWDGLTFDGWDDVKTTQYWCDDCGDAIEKGNEFFYAELPCDIASANKGESATVCRKCDKRIEADCCNKDFHTSH